MIGSGFFSEFKKLVSKPAFFVCAALALQLPAFAQPAPAPTRAAFDIDIQAPDEVREHLERHIELQRYRGLSDLDALELERLMAAARQNVQDLMGTLGYFSPRIELGLVQTGVSSAPVGGAPTGARASSGIHKHRVRQLFFRRYEPDQVHGFGLLLCRVAISARNMRTPRSKKHCKHLPATVGAGCRAGRGRVG